MGIKSGNRVLLREAVQFYCKGLEVGCTDTSLISVLYANRAQVELMLGMVEAGPRRSMHAGRVALPGGAVQATGERP